MKFNKNIIINLLKILVGILAFAYIWYRLKNSQFNFSILLKLDFSEILLILFVISLMPLNWFIESIKWRFLIKNIEKISFKKAFQAVLSGIPLAIFTPNRVGELAGRVLILKKENRTKAVFATATGSLSQLTATVIYGFISMIFLFTIFKNQTHIFSDFQIKILVSSSIISLILVVFLLFNLKIVVNFVKKFKFLQKLYEPIKILSSYKKKANLKVLLLSLLRYFVFLFQFYLLLKIFGAEISFLKAFTAISLSYFFSSIVPTVAITELGIRTSATIFFIGIFINNISIIITATIAVWTINLVLPAIIGYFFFIKTKE